ncbi:MAG: hypothetical protein HY996_07435 [Micrococcales bacterium]|nr:hypothetical protein [Micrococcales bacterium]
MRPVVGVAAARSFFLGLLILTAVAVLSSHTRGAGAAFASVLTSPTASASSGSVETAPPEDVTCIPAEDGQPAQVDCLAAPTWQGDLGPDTEPAEHLAVPAARPGSPPSQARDPRAPNDASASPVLRI